MEIVGILCGLVAIFVIGLSVGIIVGYYRLALWLAKHPRSRWWGYIKRHQS